MILESVRVQRFRSIEDATLDCDGITALVGANGSGKSSFLKAIEMFHDDKAEIAITDKDYHKNNTENAITVSVTFADLPAEAADIFSCYVTNGKLVVNRVFAWDDKAGRANSTFSSQLHVNPDFLNVRTATDAAQVRAMYKELQNNPKYGNFPKLTTKNEIIKQLDKYDGENPDKRTKVIDEYAAFQSIWKHKDEFVRFLTVPAVHDASEDANDAKNSQLALLTMTVKQHIGGDPKYREFCDDVRKRRKKVMANFDGELKEIGGDITEILQQFVRGAKVDLSWSDEFPDMGLPKTDVVLNEDGHESTVDRAGHGSQRAFIMAMLQAMARMQQDRPTEQARAGSPTIILSIEEPELYQHPIRQRHISAVLDSLTKPINGHRMQIIYTTHSPHFAGIDKLNHIRLLRKASTAGRGSGSTKVYKTDTQQVADKLNSLKCNQKEISKDSVGERLKVIMTPWLNEGFFAKLVVLVEGSSDYAAITGMSRLRRHNFEESGISVIPCDGKQKMHYPFIIFAGLKIPVYAVWDCDNRPRKPKCRCNGPTNGNVHKNEEDPSVEKNDGNCYLRNLLGSRSTDTQIEDDFSCFEQDLEKTMAKDVGNDLLHDLVSEQKKRFGMEGEDRKQVLGKSRIMREVLHQAKEKGRPCKSLEGIVEKIVAKAGS